uniref:Uncharacterized protein n=1 Tax=Timema bartmani TaxID=61472 RepID=A0A7R9FBM6_9NEOP|nr:unnamed protein product [Timema bartmani]CAD7450714.1 unnamed protein product [Timema bartmani]
MQPGTPPSCHSGSGGRRMQLSTYLNTANDPKTIFWTLRDFSGMEGERRLLGMDT